MEGKYKIPCKVYTELVKQSEKYKDEMVYVDEMSHSPIWGDPEGSAVPVERIIAIRSIWENVHMRVQDLAAMMGCSQRKIAERFGIGYPTMEHWARCERIPQAHIALMIGECLGQARYQVVIKPEEEKSSSGGKKTI